MQGSSSLAVGVMRHRMLLFVPVPQFLAVWDTLQAIAAASFPGIEGIFEMTFLFLFPSWHNMSSQGCGLHSCPLPLPPEEEEKKGRASVGARSTSRGSPDGFTAAAASAAPAERTAGAARRAAQRQMASAESAAWKSSRASETTHTAAGRGASCSLSRRP